MPNPEFLVEGHMEQAIIQKICPKQPVRLIGCNGDSVPISRMCDFIATHIRLLGNRYYPIFLIFDREKREQPSSAISTEVLLDLQKRELGEQDVRVFVADREFEDWYLMDIESICDKYSIKVPPNNLKGKGGLTKLLENVEKYHEKTVGVDIFFTVSHSKIADNCGIYQALMESSLEIGCEYFKIALAKAE